MATKKVSLHPIEDAILNAVDKLRKLEPLVDAHGKKKIAEAIPLLKEAKSNIIVLCPKQPINPPHSILFTLAGKKRPRPVRLRGRK